MNNLFIDQDDITRAVDSIANPLEHLVGEGRKFKTTDDLAKGKLHSDLMIDRLTIEKMELKAREDELKAELDRLRENSKSTLETLTREAQHGSQNTNENNSQPKMITEQDIDARVEAKLKSERDAHIRMTNVETVRNQLQQTWGNDWQTKLEEASKEYGGKEVLASLAETNPKALLKLVGAPTNTTPKPALFTEPPTSTHRPNFAHQGETNKGEKYFAKMRKENPNAYWTGEALRERVEMMQKLGSDYSKY